MSKVLPLSQAVAPIEDGAVVALGGNTLHRTPSAAVHELIRQGKRRLTVVKTAGGYDIDLLCGSGTAEKVCAAYVGFEQFFGVAPHFRRAVEQGRAQLVEHTCATVIAGLRAAAQGVSFLPIAGVTGGDLAQANGFLPVRDPYTGQEWVSVPAIKPDWVLLHVHEADAYGNARIRGAVYEDLIMAQTGAKVIVTCERLVDTDALFDGKGTVIPGFLVTSVSVVPRGAWPAACPDHYDMDREFLDAYIRAARDGEAFAAFLSENLLPRAAQEVATAAEAVAPAEARPGGAVWPAVSEVRPGSAVRPARAEAPHGGAVRPTVAEARPGSAVRPAAAVRPSPDEFDVVDLMAIAMARLLHDRETVFVGLSSPLALVSCLLAQALHAPRLTVLTLPGGINPKAGSLPLSTVDSQLRQGSPAAVTLAEVFDLSARGRLDTVFLSGVQIDRFGRINMSAIGPYERPKVRLPGGAGSAFLLPTARRTILWRTKHDRRAFVEKVDFATAAGRVEWVVTPLAIFRRGEDGLALASLHPGVSLQTLAENTGFPVDAAQAAETARPTPDELEALYTVDPEGIRRTEF